MIIFSTPTTFIACYEIPQKIIINYADMRKVIINFWFFIIKCL